MLNPIKSLFSYLNKNANSEKPNELSMTEEVNQAPENDGENFDDPLTDPLALDIEVELGNNDEKENEEDEESAIEISTNSIEEIIFVDIEKLKHRVEDREEKKQQQQQNNTKQKETNYVKKSDINGNERQALSNCKPQRTTTEDTIGTNDSSSPSDENQKNNKSGDKETEKNTLDKSADSSSVISVISSEPENDENTDISEIRSDGSDSGLGSDTLRSVSAIERNLKLLTPAKSSLKRRSNETLHNDETKKPKHSINFSDITIYYFPRCQGFSCVPTQGGSSLGMTSKHAYKRVFTLAEHMLEQRRLNRLKLAGELNESLSSSDDSKSDDEISENSFSEGDSEAYGFLQPVTARQRRGILKSAGVKKIDTMEKDECRQLRLSREVCGCTCRGYCDPDTCECSQAGIKCQVDRLKPHEFPCGCTRDGCGNVNGRVEFNPARVKTHFIHTIMRLELEKRQEMSDDAASSSSSVIQNHPKWWSQMRMQQTTSNQTNNCNYTYSASASSSSSSSSTSTQQHYNNKVAQHQQQQESIDLHYAYRDDYINNPINTDNTSSFSNSSNGSEYYSTYSYLPNVSTTPNNHYHHQNNGYQQQHQNVHHLPYYTSDCQYSNYSATNGSNRYHLKNDVSLDINGFYSTLHSGNVSNQPSPQPSSSTRSASYQQQSNGVELLPIVNENFGASVNIVANTNQQQQQISNSTAATTTIPSGEVEENNQQQQQQDSNENLCEIIKKSIVETVTA